MFKVIEIINGNTIRVAPGWIWGEYAGSIVKITGYDLTEAYDSFAINKLNTLIKDKVVELKKVVSAEKKEEPKNDILNCAVILNDVDISQYFPELKVS